MLFQFALIDRFLFLLRFVFKCETWLTGVHSWTMPCIFVLLSHLHFRRTRTSTLTPTNKANIDLNPNLHTPSPHTLKLGTGSAEQDPVGDEMHGSLFTPRKGADVGVFSASVSSPPRVVKRMIFISISNITMSPFLQDALNKSNRR
jgi:hypothetical protein